MFIEENLGAICDRGNGKIQTGPFGSQLHEYDYIDDGLPVIMPKDIVNGQIVNETVARISEEKSYELSRHKLKQGAIVMPRRGEINKRAFITEKEEGWLCGTGCIKVELKGEELFPKFFYYYLHQPSIVGWIEKKAIGTTMLNLNTSIIRNIPIKRPPIETQKRIAEILSAYDDLIENNLKRIRLLEESARLLYREWFVRLKFPNHEHTPLIDGLPEGWESGVISDFYDTGSGGTPSRLNPDYFTGDIFWIKTQELKDSFIIDTGEKITEEALKHSAAKLFPAKTVLVAMYGATIGQLGITACPATTNQACCALMPRVQNANYIYAFLFLKENKQQLINLAMGAAQNNINQQTVRNFEMILPSIKVMENFVEITEPMFKAISNLLEQNQKLKQARDLLLPRLMSGEIAV